MQLRILDTGIQSAERNMEIDAELLNSLHPDDLPILHLYEWSSPSATYGHFLNPHDFFIQDAIKSEGLTLAKRPTGGGIIFHLTDFAFSLLIPANHPGYSINTMDNYCYVNKKIMGVIREFSPTLLGVDPHPATNQCAHFCMAKPTKYDVMIGSKKVGGAAQRRTKNGFLHQGSISLSRPPLEIIQKVLVNPAEVIAAMEANTFDLCQKGSTQSNEALSSAKVKLKELISLSF
jgi:lipoate-protein ligase A